MKKFIIFPVIFFVLSAVAQKTDKTLEKKIRELVQGFHGTVGIYVHELKKDRIASFNADTVFPTASIVKDSDHDWHYGQNSK